MPLDHRSYEEAADDVYKDSIEELEMINEELQSEGMKTAIDYLKEKRKELYG